MGLSTTSLVPTLALLVTRVQPESILHVRLRLLFQSHAQIALGSVTENRHEILLGGTIQSTGIRRACAPKIPGTEVVVCLNPLHPIVLLGVVETGLLGLDLGWFCSAVGA